MNTYQTIRFRFIRDAHNAKDDDILKLTPVFKENGEFDYFDVIQILRIAPAGRREKSITRMSHFAFHQWFSSLLTFLEVDTEDPLDALQIEMPLLPTILVQPTGLRASWNAIYNWLLCLQAPGAWPKVTEDIPPPQRRHDHRHDHRHDISDAPVDDVVNNVQVHAQRPVRRHTFFDEDGTMRVIARFV